jgi:hypothetical protein
MSLRNPRYERFAYGLAEGKPAHQAYIDAGFAKAGAAQRRENKIVDEFENMSNQEIEAWLDERAEARVRVRQRSHGPQRRGGIGTARPTTAQGKPH